MMNGVMRQGRKRELRYRPVADIFSMGLWEHRGLNALSARPRKLVFPEKFLGMRLRWDSHAMA